MIWSAALTHNEILSFVFGGILSHLTANCNKSEKNERNIDLQKTVCHTDSRSTVSRLTVGLRYEKITVRLEDVFFIAEAAEKIAAYTFFRYEQRSFLIV